MIPIWMAITTAMASDWKQTTIPLTKPLYSGENHSQAISSDAIWNRLVPKAVKMLCMMIKVQTFEHMMNEMDPVRTHTHPKQRTALIGVLNKEFAAIGAKSPDTMSMLK